MKKVFCLFLSLIVLIGLSACDAELPDDSQKPNPEESLCLTFVSKGRSTIALVEVGEPYYEVTLEYSMDGNNWDLYAIGETLSLSDSEKLMFRAGEDGNEEFSDICGYYNFKISGSVSAKGNIMSLLDRKCSRNYVPSFAFYGLFQDCTGLTSPPVLPAKILSDYCYSQMFWGCTNLTEAPALPATELDSSCYDYMFSGCKSLTKAPTLPATELAEECYTQMFYGCSGLTEAPELPATKLAEGCYWGMFKDCSKLTEAPALPATKLAKWCYRDMFSGCTSLTTAPALPATKLSSRWRACYKSMFEGCTSLTKAPDLPATNLVEDCYASMFYGCTKLNYVKALFTDEPSESTTSGWLYGVASTGTFVKSKDATWHVRGIDGIPYGWTVEGGSFTAILTVFGTKDNAIIVADAGKTFKLTVKSNLSWTASCDADWIEIDPASVENTDNEYIVTKVSVVVEKNSYKDRSAEIKFVAEGVEPVIITVKQHAKESILCVWDMDNFKPSENPAISTDFYAEKLYLVIHANVDWTATCPSWITLDPTSNKYDGQTQNVTVEAVISVNDEVDARTGEIKFVGENAPDLVIPVKQSKATRVKATLKETEHPYIDVDFEIVPDEGITWIAMNFNDEELADFAKKNITPGDFIISRLNYLLEEERSVSKIIASFLTSGNSIKKVNNLKAETHYQFAVIGATYDNDYQQFIPTTLPTYIEYTTAKAPAAEAAYEALAGTYEMKVYSQREKKETTLQMVVAPLYINEAYTFHFPNGDFSPVQEQFFDKFVMVYDSANKALTIPNGLLGSEGVTWVFIDSKTGKEFDGGILFYVEVGETSKEDGTEAAVPESLVYNWTDDHNTLNLATDLGGKNLHWYALVANLNSEDKLEILGSFSRYTFAGSTSLVKIGTTTSTKSVRSKESFGYVKSLLPDGLLKYNRKMNLESF